ncbi:hypothetical protein CEXT_551291 [Caerostris extrusa]|uniref:Uncharacterized protein n=1 Tax=Caerostris extrusa TaxID=172846 RepID=A0AAV4Q834_CAEEX|nr:hypothetical protein CEXT_551291 [Caerostris extrusa]
MIEDLQDISGDRSPGFLLPRMEYEYYTGDERHSFGLREEGKGCDPQQAPLNQIVITIGSSIAEPPWLDNGKVTSLLYKTRMIYL